MRPPARSLEFTQVTEWKDGAVHSQQDSIAAEEPLEIRVDGTPRASRCGRLGTISNWLWGFC